MATKSPVITIEPHPNLPLTAPFTEIAVRQAAGDLVRIRTGMFAGCTVRWITGKHIHDTPKPTKGTAMNTKENYMEDAKGRLIPVESISQIDMMKHEFVIEMVKRAAEKAKS